jgi:hypothetical protein
MLGCAGVRTKCAYQTAKRKSAFHTDVPPKLAFLNLWVATQIWVTHLCLVGQEMITFMLVFRTYMFIFISFTH